MKSVIIRPGSFYERNSWTFFFFSLFSFFFYLLSTALFGQETRQYLYLQDPTYDYIDYLINAGKLQTGFVLRQPYQTAVLDSVQDKSAAGKYFKQYWNYYYKDTDASFQLQARDEVRYDHALYNRWAATGGVHLSVPHVTLGNRTTADQDFKHDPDYAGDLSESAHWLYGRVNDAYINAFSGGFDFFLGRMNRNWGPIGSPSLILSDHPYSYDHFLFDFTYKILRISLIFAQLENLDALELKGNDGEIVPVKNARKSLVGHRLDLSFSDNFQIALTEMATYGGEGRDIEFAFFNPLNFYYGIQRNDRKPMNGRWQLDLFYKPHPQLSLYGQFHIDDVIVNNEPGQDDRARYPDRLGLSLSVRSADLLLNGLNLQLDYVRIGNRTYQSRYTYENYHARELGLGYPAASTEELRLKLSTWHWFPFYLSNDLRIGRYGDVALTDVFPLEKEDFPVAPVTNNLLNTSELRYFASRWFQFRASAHYSKEANHYLNRIDPLKGWRFSLGLQVTLAAGVNL